MHLILSGSFRGGQHTLRTTAYLTVTIVSEILIKATSTSLSTLPRSCSADAGSVLLCGLPDSCTGFAP